VHQDSEDLPCQRCGEVPEDLWRCRRGLKIALLCPGCVATLRERGESVLVMGGHR